MIAEAAPYDPSLLSFSRVLVTGADGFVGRHLVPALRRALAPGATIITTTRDTELASDDCVLLDLDQNDTVGSAIKAMAPDAIVHLAAQASVGHSANAAAQTWSTNLSGSLALATAIAEYCPDATVLFASSAEVYGSTFNDGIASEASPLRPNSAYARSKAAAEWMFDDILPPSCRLLITRASNHSGAGQSIAFVLPSFAAQIAAIERGRTDTLSVGQIDSRRDFLAVDDVVDAYIRLLRMAPSLPVRNVFNIASGTARRIGDLLDAMIAMAKRPPRIVQDPARLRPSEVPTVHLDNRALRALGWSPTVSIETMLAAVLNDQRGQKADAPFDREDSGRVQGR